MTLWWDSLTLVQQIMALFAIPATIIMILQTLLLLFGLGSHGDADAGGLDTHAGDIAEHDAGESHGHGHHSGAHDGGLRIFTVRAFVAFFAIFGWLGIVLTESGMGSTLAILFSFIAGLAAMVGMAWFFKSAMKLQSAGNIDMRNCLGKSATVYIPIPPNRQGKGKVNLTVQGRFSEMDAVTDSAAALKTGSEVIISSILNNNTLCVEPRVAHPAMEG